MLQRTAGHRFFLLLGRLFPPPLSNAFGGGEAMHTPSFTIGGTPTPFAAAWVQLKICPYEPTGYELCVPRALWPAVFNPGAERGESLSWPEFLRSEVEEYGMISFWLSVLAKYFPSELRRWEWVIATVDQISEREDHIRVAGRAERFEPRRFPPLALRTLG